MTDNAQDASGIFHSYGIGATVIPLGGFGLSVTVSQLFDDTDQRNWVGFSIAIGGGASLLPGSVSYMETNTELKELNGFALSNKVKQALLSDYDGIMSNALSPLNDEITRLKSEIENWESSVDYWIKNEESPSGKSYDDAIKFGEMELFNKYNELYDLEQRKEKTIETLEGLKQQLQEN